VKWNLSNIFGWAFGVAALCLGLPFLLQELAPRLFSAIFEAHSWLWYVAFTPIVVYILVFLMVAVVMTINYTIGEFRSLRSQGYSVPRALLYAVILLAILALLMYCGSIGGNRFTD